MCSVILSHEHLSLTKYSLSSHHVFFLATSKPKMRINVWNHTLKDYTFQDMLCLMKIKMKMLLYFLLTINMLYHHTNFFLYSLISSSHQQSQSLSLRRHWHLKKVSLPLQHLLLGTLYNSFFHNLLLSQVI